MQNKAKKRLFHFALKRKEKIGSETKRNETFLEMKQSGNAVLISLWLEAKNSKQKGEKKKTFTRACKTHANGSLFASFRLKAKIFFAKPVHPMLVFSSSSPSGLKGFRKLLVLP